MLCRWTKVYIISVRADYIAVFLIRVSRYCDLSLNKSLYFICVCWLYSCVLDYSKYVDIVICRWTKVYIVSVCADYIAVFLIIVSRYCDLSLNKSLYFICVCWLYSCVLDYSKYVDIVICRWTKVYIVSVCADYIAVFLIIVSRYCDLLLTKSPY